MENYLVRYKSDSLILRPFRCTGPALIPIKSQLTYINWMKYIGSADVASDVQTQRTSTISVITNLDEKSPDPAYVRFKGNLLYLKNRHLGRREKAKAARTDATIAQIVRSIFGYASSLYSDEPWNPAYLGKREYFFYLRDHDMHRLKITSPSDWDMAPLMTVAGLLNCTGRVKIYETERLPHVAPLQSPCEITCIRRDGAGGMLICEESKKALLITTLRLLGFDILSPSN